MNTRSQTSSILLACFGCTLAVAAVFMPARAKDEPEPLPTSGSLTLDSSQVRTLSFARASSLKVGELSTSGNLTFVFASGHEILSVRGIETAIDATPQGVPANVYMPRYLRPKQPDEVKVTLWTADGRKWVAKWEEAKP